MAAWQQCICGAPKVSCRRYPLAAEGRTMKVKSDEINSKSVEKEMTPIYPQGMLEVEQKTESQHNNVTQP
jgi:hypothetical protein